MVTVRPLFFENLFNEPADSRFPKIRIKKWDFGFFYSRQSEIRVRIIFCVMCLQMAVNGHGKNVSLEV